jgi:putative secretion ATPase (PEP-CTERM system associated)
MYERFYNLRERPFSLSPDPDYLYPSRVHREALGYLRYGIEGHAGFVVITGEIGCGKTTLLQTMLRSLDRQTSVSRLVNTMLDARELIEAVMLDFGLEPGQGRSKPHLLRDLARFLVDQRMAGRLALLVIDEAQNLSPAALEEVRMLSNLETEKSKLIQILLVGQPNLREVLARPELEQLRQRVTVSYHIEPLDMDETAAYINHRLRRAAIGAPLEFSRGITDLIHHSSEGIPRKINVIADAILLFGYGEERRVIDVNLVKEVVEELGSIGLLSARGVPHNPTSAQVSAPIPDPAAPLDVPGAPIVLPAATTAPRAAASYDRELQERETQLAERERRFAEQQRVVMEGYRLLRHTRDELARSAPPSSAPRPAWPPAKPAPDAKPAVAVSAPRASDEMLQPQSHRVFRDLSRGPEGFWTRLRRSLFSAGKPIFEDWRV